MNESPTRTVISTPAGPPGAAKESCAPRLPDVDDAAATPAPRAVLLAQSSELLGAMAALPFTTRAVMFARRCT